nr:MAG TPA: hypothetical protein [Caudoviricetes sp.]
MLYLCSGLEFDFFLQNFFLPRFGGAFFMSFSQVFSEAIFAQNKL